MQLLITNTDSIADFISMATLPLAQDSIIQATGCVIPVATYCQTTYLQQRMAGCVTPAQHQAGISQRRTASSNSPLRCLDRRPLAPDRCRCIAPAAPASSSRPCPEFPTLAPPVASAWKACISCVTPTRPSDAARPCQAVVAVAAVAPVALPTPSSCRNSPLSCSFRSRLLASELRCWSEPSAAPPG